MMHIEIPRALYEINPASFVRKLLALGIITALCAGIVLVGPSLLMPLAQVVLGVIFATAVEMQHHCLHRTAFRSGKYSKQLHRAVGILLGLPMLVSYSHYRARHLEHHKWVGTPKDKEFFDYDRDFQSSWTSLICQTFSLRRYNSIFRHMCDAIRGRACADARNFEEAKHIRQEYCLMAALLVITCAVSLGTHSLLLIKLWVIPLILSAEAAHYLIELPEHFRCDINTQDMFRNTRTVVGSWFSHWVTHFNNFHIEHHFHPGIPLDKLGELHRIVAPYEQYCVPSYWAFFSSIVRK